MGYYASIFFFNFLFLIGGWLFYNVALLSAIQQCESATSTHMSPPSYPPPHPTSLGCHRALGELSVLYITFPLAICFTYGMYMIQCHSLSFLPLSPSPAVSTSLWVCVLCVCVFLSCKLVHQYHFSRFHIYALIYDIFHADLLHSV